MMESSLVMARMSDWVMALDLPRRAGRESLLADAGGTTDLTALAPASLICSGVSPWERS